MTLTSSLLRLSRLLVASLGAVAVAEVARINVTKPYKPRRLKMDPVSTMRRRLYQLTTKDPKTVRKRELYRKVYTRKNKQLLDRRREFVNKAKDRLPAKPGTVNTKRSSSTN